MTNPNHEINLAELDPCRLKSVGRPIAILLILAVLGFLAAGVSSRFVEDGSRRFFQGYLVAFSFVLSISLGAMFFVLIQHLMRAGWAVVVRRLAEILGFNILVVGLLFLPIAWSVWQGDGLVYSWSKTHSDPSHAVQSQRSSTESESLHRPVMTDVANTVPVSEPTSSAGSRSSSSSEVVETGTVMGAHAAPKPYLDNTRFLVTWAVLFGVWILLASFYFRTSVGQDKTRDFRMTLRMEWWSGIAVILFGFSLTVGAFDLLMSLDPNWYSTIFGVYYFSGCVVAALASLLLIVLLLRRLQWVPNVFSEEVQRDLGRLLFAFVFFWAYIGFSQYMLLWYANMPETTGWLVKRGMSTATGYANSWGWLAVLLLLAHFVLPFVGMMSRHVKSDSRAMMFWAIWLLVVHYLDLYWIVVPESHAGLTVSGVEMGAAVGVVSVYALAAIWFGSCFNLFAVGDPRMSESLTRHAMY